MITAQRNEGGRRGSDAKPVPVRVEEFRYIIELLLLHSPSGCLKSAH